MRETWLSGGAAALRLPPRWRHPLWRQVKAIGVLGRLNELDTCLVARASEPVLLLWAEESASGKQEMELREAAAFASGGCQLMGILTWVSLSLFPPPKAQIKASCKAEIPHSGAVIGWYQGGNEAGVLSM
uniref:Uncharacterized protein n=1 Tax=Sphaerodactylus townsendi TaxID=933632 RepID=A0ACB8E784_9SAUR